MSAGDRSGPGMLNLASLLRNVPCPASRTTSSSAGAIAAPISTKAARMLSAVDRARIRVGSSSVLSPRYVIRSAGTPYFSVAASANRLSHP